MIVYRDASAEPVDLEQLAALFESVGWQHRTRDKTRLAQMVRGSMYAVSAHDGDRLVGYARPSPTTRSMPTSARSPCYPATSGAASGGS